MRSRAAVSLFLMVLVPTIVLVAAPAASAAVLAQQPNEDTGTTGGDAQDPGEGEGQDDPAAETGAGEGETEEGTSAETTGPPWTYQMAWITLALLVLLALGLGYLYFRLVASRRRGEA